ncbi:hypothetical protein [Perlucidibaca aquatica]|uniref:hypothetical protein n=1 Tax=Perlucidibaca aquatica TaxID=1852776 RepID=UPI00083B4F20|nr:hypothetical protein [Perlucidibaca aquatica]
MSDLDPIILNLIYATTGSILSLLISWTASAVFEKRMGFRIKDALSAGNLSVGLVMLGIFVGNGIGMGIIIGLSLN